MTALKIILVLILVLLLAVVALRVRKLRRDDMRALEKKSDARLMAPPASPYQSSKGFRLLEGNEAPTSLPPPTRPRLEPDQKYVFSDFHPARLEVNPPGRARHDEEWALSRSANRPGLSLGFAGVLIVIVVIALLVGVVGYYARDHRHHTTSHVTTTVRRGTTTTTTSPTTTTS